MAGYYLYGPWSRARTVFIDLLYRGGWAVALAVAVVLYAVSEHWRFIKWALAEAFPYPASLTGRPHGSRETVLTLGHSRARAYQRRRLERAVDGNIATGVGLRLAS